MSRLFSKIAWIAAITVLGCSAADLDEDDVVDDPMPAGGGGAGGTTTEGGSDPGGGGGSGGGNGGSGGDDCPADVICVDSLPFVDTNTTVGGNAVLDGYGCAPTTNEGGPERVYRVDLAEGGLLVASLDGLGDGVDVDVHVLEELDPGTCLDRGHWDAAALVPAGRFWVVVDSWVDGTISQEGSYELTLAQTTAGSHASMGLTPTVLDAGLRAFALGWEFGDTVELEYGIVDYTMPSIEPRFFVLDLRQGDLLYAELVSHGEGSQDPNDITLTGNMSNIEGSHASSLGLVVTAETYSGSNGYSLRLDGLEVGFNHNDRDRAIVVHGADYATQSFITTYGYLGRSWGCPAIDPAVSDQLIDTLANGRLLLKYFDDQDWLSSSVYVGP